MNCRTKLSFFKRREIHSYDNLITIYTMYCTAATKIKSLRNCVKAGLTDLVAANGGEVVVS